ncbi:lethal (2) giant discs 1 isoform X2 [Ptiloglossa arizonensis]|uniref:lethal (2) giant discs 1 isoform X2 n=1 Tax=Ptiloglossa arizonensis TaxID=3350558 RepID=UPI003FA18044
MFGKKEKPKRQTKTAGSLAQFGIFEIPESLDDLDNDFMNDDDNDEDLEAELAKLTAGDDISQKPRRRAPRKPIPNVDLDAMVAESMKDTHLDEEESDGEDDPELLRELNKMITNDESPEEVTPEEETNVVTENVEPPELKENNTSMENIIQLLQERLRIYQIAEKKMKQENELSRARRYNRSIKTLKDLLNDAQLGKAINEADIPPQLPASATRELTEKISGSGKEETTEHTSASVEISTPSAENSAPSELVLTKAIDEETLNLLKSRQQEYKVAAVAWKRAGNKKEALQCVNIAKQFDLVIAEVNAGKTVDLSDMPPSPNIPGSDTSISTTEPKKIENETQGQSSSEIAPSETPETKPTGPENIELALKERLEVYRRTKTAAETEGNSAKARRYGRICKQFEDALKLHARGKPVILDELPVPPGFPPLSTAPQVNASAPEEIPQNAPEPEPPENKSTLSPKSPVSPSNVKIAKKQNQKVSRADKQLSLLQQRQHELKQAAVNAKKDGDLDLARNYLRQAKGIDPLIQASMAGLPVDMNSIPLSPLAKLELNAGGTSDQFDDNFMLVNSVDCLEEATGTDEQIYENLESQLMKQIKWCLCTRDHSKALGDVSGYNRWERLAFGYKRDLDMLRVRKRDALPPPQHHYETKTYAIVKSCTDLNEGDIEISIIRGVNIPKEDTYVMFEFPYPSDSPPSDRTSTVKGTCNPEYQAVFPLTGIIDRTSRQCQRVFKRHALKCQVWAKGGFFRSDSLLGTVTVKLQPLETQCELHDSFPLLDGRKPTGGKLELKIRLRNPILTKQVEQITDKWLIIDQ